MLAGSKDGLRTAALSALCQIIPTALKNLQGSRRRLKGWSRSMCRPFPPFRETGQTGRSISSKRLSISHKKHSFALEGADAHRQGRAIERNCTVVGPIAAKGTSMDGRRKRKLLAAAPGFSWTGAIWSGVAAVSAYCLYYSHRHGILTEIQIELLVFLAVPVAAFVLSGIGQDPSQD
ncbi:hypothetical protein WBP07_22625 (plasmid) [Novosphingobium sp. BL-8A]|uniref:hypothetical protein n=1 Tax=Novosphingobium sp. BL-8A TaxID=3127639 RepID=UPI003756EE71